jgi:hypothetical protein
LEPTHNALAFSREKRERVREKRKRILLATGYLEDVVDVVVVVDGSVVVVVVDEGDIGLHTRFFFSLSLFSSSLSELS